VQKPRKKKRDQRKATGFSIPESILTELRKVAAREDRSLSYIAAIALREFVERRKSAAA
jgi:predicted transcriptional regulator